MKTRKELLKEIEQLKAAICEAENSVAIGEGVDLWYYERQMRGRNEPEPAWVTLIKEVTKDCKYRRDKQ